jgi:hypothetical protein
MKKIILLLTFTLLLVSCSSDDNNSSGSDGNGNTTNGNVNYDFKININGVEHKVQGNTSGFGTGISGNSYLFNPNSCQAQISNTTSLTFKIADITKPNFVSGQTLFMMLNIPNCQVGQNQAEFAIFQSPVYDIFSSNLVIPNGYWGFQQNSGTYSSSTITSTRNKITVNITDMGTSLTSSVTSSGQSFNYGNTFKGNFTGPVYLPSTISGSQCNYNTPMQLDMSFSAYRIN